MSVRTVTGRPIEGDFQRRSPLVAYLKRIPLRVVDIGLAILAGVAIAFAISVAEESGASRSPDALGYGLGALIAAYTLVRRRWPVGVLVASVVTLQVYYSADYPGILPGVALAAALFSAAAAGHLRESIAVVAWFWVIPIIYSILGVLGSRVDMMNQLVRDGAIMLVAILFGDAVRSHRALMADASEKLRRAEDDLKREERELSAARTIQMQLLPTTLPSLPGWELAARYMPARAVGGDFYDIRQLPGGQLAIITGDATDKGIPAALVMATTHSILRGQVPEQGSPGAALAYANQRLFQDIPPQMFVTCLYAVLDPASGQVRLANAGHNLPYLAGGASVSEVRATGMPLGALPETAYDEAHVRLRPGDTLLLSSDGFVEARNAMGEMFGFPRLEAVVGQGRGGEHLIEECLAALRCFVGDDWEQEDDITLVTIQRTGEAA